MLPKPLKTLDKILEYFETYAVGIATLIMVAIMFINVILRNLNPLFPDTPLGLTWGNELSNYLNIFAVYIAISAGFKYGSHVGVDLVTEHIIPKKARKFFRVLSYVFVLIFCAIVVYIAFGMFLSQIQSAHPQGSPILNFPIYIIYLIVMFGMLLSFIRCCLKIIEIVTTKGDDDESVLPPDVNAEILGIEKEVK